MKKLQVELLTKTYGSLQGRRNPESLTGQRCTLLFSLPVTEAGKETKGFMISHEWERKLYLKLAKSIGVKIRTFKVDGDGIMVVRVK